jgi:hypothetical protein
LNNLKKGKTKTLQELARYIAAVIKNNQDQFFEDSSPIWHQIIHPKLETYFNLLVLNRVPPNCFPRFFGHSNVYINYDIDDVSFDESDVDDVIQAIYNKKNNGTADMLLIWSDEFELGSFDHRKLAEKIYRSFQASTFDEVFFMTFINILPDFLKSLQLWALKGKRVPMIAVEDGTVSI